MVWMQGKFILSVLVFIAQRLQRDKNVPRLLREHGYPKHREEDHCRRETSPHAIISISKSERSKNHAAVRILEIRDRLRP